MTSPTLDFTPDQDWVTKNHDNWLRCLTPFIGQPGILALEIGTWEGRSAHWFVSHVLQGQGSALVTVDQSLNRFEKNRAALNAIHGDKLQPHQSDAARFLESRFESQFAAQPYHFIYLDGSKDAADVLETTVLAWRLLKPGGVLIWDDHGWPGTLPNRNTDPPWHFANPPRLAIDAFLQTHIQHLDRLHHGWQVIVRKK